MRGFRRLSFRLLPLLIGLAASPADAADLRLVTGPDYPPFAGPNLPHGGLATEIVLAAFEAAGRPVEPIEFLPWKRGYEGVLDGAFDATFPYVDTPERQHFMRYSVPLYSVQSWAVFRGDRMRSYTGPESLVGLTLCMPVGYAPPQPLLPLIETGQVLVAQPATMSLCARQLMAGRVDFVINSPMLFETMVLSEWHGGPPPEMADHPVTDNPLALLVNRQNPEGAAILADFARGLDLLKASGRYDGIVRRHLTAAASTE